MEIYSTNDIGDQTYPYKIINNTTSIIKEIVDGNHELSRK